jgi:hypothetical protein
MFTSIIDLLRKLLLGQTEANQLAVESNQQMSLIAAHLSAIVVLLTPPPPTHFTIELTEGDTTMASKATKGKLKLNILDNGTATATLTLIDAAGLPTQLPAGSTVTGPWASSDPGVVVTPDATDLVAAVAPATPPVLVTGAVITAGPLVMTNADDTTVNLGSASTTDPINVVAGGPAGFKITVA